MRPFHCSIFRPVLLLPLALVLAAMPEAVPGQEPGEPGPEFAQELERGKTAEIQPGDRIAIAVWREPDWSGQFDVDDRGIVVLPRLGPVRVEGQSVSAVRDELTERYGEFLRTPAVEVRVLRRIGVHGEVRAPTLYWLDLTMTLRDAIAMAGGLTPAGDPNKIIVERRGERFRFGEAETVAAIAAGLESGDQIVVEQRSWFALNTPFVISTVVSVSSILVGFLIAR
jgi:protein involved in polysaccharide export with SLBB domain